MGCRTQREPGGTWRFYLLAERTARRGHRRVRSCHRRVCTRGHARRSALRCRGFSRPEPIRHRPRRRIGNFTGFKRRPRKAPQSLELQSDVLDVLLRRHALLRHAGVRGCRAGGNPIDEFSNESCTQDYDEQRPWFLNLREIALERAGRWDEAVAQLTAASAAARGKAAAASVN
jgi:hypothetical protein